MTGTTKLTSGIVLNIVGAFLLFAGILLSFTIIGACIGIPMILIAFPLFILGIVWTIQGRTEKQQEAIAVGIQQGLQHVSQSPGAARLPLGESLAEARPASLPEGERGPSRTAGHDEAASGAESTGLFPEGATDTPKGPGN